MCSLSTGEDQNEAEIKFAIVNPFISVLCQCINSFCRPEEPVFRGDANTTSMVIDKKVSNTSVPDYVVYMLCSHNSDKPLALLVEVKTVRKYTDNAIASSVSYQTSSGICPPLAIVVCENIFQFTFFPFMSADSKIPYVNAVVSPEINLLTDLHFNENVFYFS